MVSHQCGLKINQPKLDDFFGSRHHRNRLGAGEVQNRALMTPFCTRNIPIMFGVQFLSCRFSTFKNCFYQILTTVLGTETRAGLKQTNLKIGPGLIGFAPKTYPHCLGCSCYCFLSVWLKNVLVKFLWLLRAWKAPEKEKLKTEHKWLDFTPETYPHCLGYSSYISHPYDWKNVSV